MTTLAQPAKRATAFAQASIQTFLATATAAGLGMLSAVVIAHAYGPAGKGAYALVTLVYVLGVTIGNFGVPLANTHFSAKSLYEQSELFASSLWLALAGGALTIPLLAVFAARRDLFRAEPGCFLIVFALIPAGIFVQSLSYLLQCGNRVGYFNLSRVLPAAATLGLTLVAWWLFPGKILGAITAWGAGIALALLVAVLGFVTMARPSLFAPARLLRQSASFGVKAWISQLMGALNFRLDFFLVAYFADAAAVGIYSVAVALSEILHFLPTAIATAVYTRLSTASDDDARRLAAQTIRCALVLGFLSAVFLGLLSGKLIAVVFGARFAAATPALLLLLPGTLIYSTAHITAVFFNAHWGKPLVNGAVSTTALALDVLLGIILIPRLGVNGAALASTIAYAGASVLNVCLFCRKAALGPGSILLVRLSDFVEARRLLAGAFSGRARS